MLLSEIISHKGSTVYTTSPNATLHDAICEMVRLGVGSLIVGRGRRIWGIITERDILRTLADRRTTQKAVRVVETMSSELVTASPEDSLESAMRVMTSRRVRHLPLFAEGKLCGIVSIGDVLMASHDQLALENDQMRGYIQSDGAAAPAPSASDQSLPPQLRARHVHTR